MQRLLPIPAAALVLAGCGDTPSAPDAENVTETVETQVYPHAEWTKDATIYEVNIRQHTPEGTFDAFTRDIPRLAEMGIEILWLMPVQPIGVENRKGGLGSYYSIQDYTAINPEFGDADALRNLVEKAHASMKNPWTGVYMGQRLDGQSDGTARIHWATLPSRA